MAYRLTYTYQMSWVPPGVGPFSTPQDYGDGAGGTGQTLAVSNQIGGQSIQGSGTGGAIQAADITTLLATVSTDISAQLNQAANLALLQRWPSGGN
jgi:hypothetical protein